MRILFNCIVSRNNELVEDMITNIQKFVKDPLIVFHVHPIKFPSFDKSVINRYKNVFVNSEQLNLDDHNANINLNTHRPFIHAFLSNFKYITNNCKEEFDYHIIFYEKMMFCRHGIEEYIKNYDGCFYYCRAVECIPNVAKYFQKGLLKNLSEGLTSNFEITKKMFDYYCSNEELYNYNGWAGEEVIVSSFLFNNCNTPGMPPVIVQPKCCATISDAVEIIEQTKYEIDALSIGKRKTSEIFIIHRVDSDLENPLRVFIRSL
uniref:Uncharacterized protein n=1 Tax=viral metagenome TaxID=1070528 RepID=A0A6C0HLB4_9ZZZZ